MFKNKYAVKYVAPVDLVDGKGDKTQTDWLVRHSNPTTKFQELGTFVDTNGNKSTVLKITGIGARRLSANFSKKFGWGRTYGALELVLGENNSAEIKKIEK